MTPTAEPAKRTRKPNRTVVQILQDEVAAYAERLARLQSREMELTTTLEQVGYSIMEIEVDIAAHTVALDALLNPGVASAEAQHG